MAFKGKNGDCLAQFQHEILFFDGYHCLPVQDADELRPGVRSRFCLLANLDDAGDISGVVGDILEHHHLGWRTYSMELMTFFWSSSFEFARHEVIERKPLLLAPNVNAMFGCVDSLWWSGEPIQMQIHRGANLGQCRRSARFTVFERND